MAAISPRRTGAGDEVVGAHAPLPRDLVRVLDWLKANLAEPIVLETLAAIAGVSPRTLETHFRQYLRTTPLGWVRRMRLMRARQQLLVRDDSMSVTQIALSSGFSQLGRFSAQYRDLFGELPSQTQARSRGAGANETDVDDEAMLLSWRAIGSAYTVAPKQCGSAIDDVAQAQELSPRYGLPKAILAWCNGQRLAHNFDALHGIKRAQVALQAEEAATLAPDDSLALNACSGAMALAHRLDEADALIERAVAIDPWSTLNWIRRGWISAYRGDSDNAIREFGVAFHMAPLHPATHVAYIGIGCAHFAAGRYDRAARWISEGVSANPDSFWADRIGVAAASLCGAHDEAGRIAKRLRQRDPDLTVTVARGSLPFVPAMIDRLGEGLARAGVSYS